MQSSTRAPRAMVPSTQPGLVADEHVDPSRDPAVGGLLWVGVRRVGRSNSYGVYRSWRERLAAERPTEAESVPRPRNSRPKSTSEERGRNVHGLRGDICRAVTAIDLAGVRNLSPRFWRPKTEIGRSGACLRLNPGLAIIRDRVFRTQEEREARMPPGPRRESGM